MRKKKLRLIFERNVISRLKNLKSEDKDVFEESFDFTNKQAAQMQAVQAIAVNIRSKNNVFEIFSSAVIRKISS